jgi:LysR family transcriptional regulator, transcriptional activator of the cysJI operon
MIDSRNHRQLDSGLFRAFHAAALELNFTAAAQKIHMTQSGLSQQVAKLEEQVGTPLFERINKRVHLTRAGELLLQFVEAQKDHTEQFLEQISKESRALDGLVRYAMPHSCLFTPHFPLLLQKRNAGFAGVTLKIDLCSNDEIFDKLLNRQIDFGFVTRESQNPAFAHQVFAREEYVLVGSKPIRFDSKEIPEIPFVDYPGMAVLFDIWRRHHFPSNRKLTFESLKIEGSINSLHAAITMISEGLGYTVMPKHCADLAAADLAQLGQKLWFYQNKGRGDPGHEIFIVSLQDTRLTQRVQAVLDAFWEMKKE